MKKTLVYIGLFWAIFQLSFGQNKQLRAYTVEDGLPQSQVNDIAQDRHGYLWLGTQGGGVCGFDGKNFQVFNTSHGLASNYIHALKVNNDTLYIGSHRGLTLKIKKQFINIEAPQVNAIYTFKNSLFLATKAGVYKLLKNRTLEKITLSPQIDNRTVNSIVFYDDQFWLATNKGLWILNDLVSSPQSIKKIETNNFVAIVAYKDQVYAATFNDGTLVFNVNSSESPILIREPLRINHMSIQNNDELWIATDTDGISIIDTQNNSEKQLLNTVSGLAVPHIRKVITDKHANIWIATSGGGFYKYFQNNFKHYTTSTGLKGNRVYAVHANKEGVWVSNSEKGLVHIHKKGVAHIEQPASVSNVKIKAITSDFKGNIWAGTDGRGLFYRRAKMIDSIVIDSSEVTQIRRDTLSKKYIETLVFNSDTGFPYDWIRSLETVKNTIWAATYSQGIVKFTFNKKKNGLIINKVFGKQDGIEDLLISTMVKDDQNRLWYATQEGTLGYIQGNKVTYLGPVLNEKVAIGVVLIKNNTVFLGTSGKGIWWTSLNELGNFKKLRGIKKITSENIYQLIFDDQGNLWAGTERGVDKIELDQDHTILDVFHFGRNDGFLGIETCLNAVDKDQYGNLWFGTIDGLTQFKPANNEKKALQPTIAFEDVKIAYKSVDTLQLPLWTNSNRVLMLTPEQTQISFSYKTIDIDHPNAIEYRSKLNNAKWSPWTKDRTQNLSGLAYGAHTFEVQSRNYRWQESEVIAFKFYIDSPIYKKAWFQWLVFSIIAVVLGVLVYRYIKRLKIKGTQERQQLELQNYLLTLEQKALRLQMNPHFIFNVLNGIKAMGVNKSEKMNATINSFATLLRETLINSRKDTISLEQEIKTLRHYIEVEKLMASKMFEYTIKLKGDLDPEEILIPPMLVQPFVENAIRHGILKGQHAGQLNVEFSTSKDLLYCKIIDNGIGIFQSQSNQPQTDHQSMALTVTRERLESITGKDALKISEIKNNDGTIGGTQILFKIPLQTDY